ncbi:hypothetical protein ANABIO32_15300 [Rossellomorea marisflavi]|nr:hypothetical protein ANABIO32_15300 [Rossellomorea marisflavi]
MMSKGVMSPVNSTSSGKNYQGFFKNKKLFFFRFYKHDKDKDESVTI